METDVVICGDALEVLRGMPDGSVNCCVTSPPYWGLRDYGTAKWEGGDPECDHALPNDAPNSKKMTVGQMSSHAGRFSGDCRRCGAHRIDSQLGLEKTPEEYVAKMVEVFREVRRVLRDDGTLWLNLGDSYGAGGKGNIYACSNSPEYANGDICFDRPKSSRSKNLVGIPWRVAFALQADGWYLRSDIIWSKPNPMPESVTDRPTKSHEYVFLLSKNARYYWDQEAVKEAGEGYGRSIWEKPQFKCGDLTRHHGNVDGHGSVTPTMKGGRNIRSVWTIATRPFKGAHFATFPEKLVEPCIKAGCPAEVCPKCGKARERIVQVRSIEARPNSGSRRGSGAYNALRNDRGSMYADTTTLGWTDCGCGAGFEPGVILDPFFGAGTVGVVAKKLGRRYIGIDLSPDYCAMARKRIAEVPQSLFAGNEGGVVGKSPDGCPQATDPAVSATPPDTEKRSV